MCEYEDEVCYGCDDATEIYDFTYVDEFGYTNHMCKEVPVLEGTIVDTLAVMKQFLLMCGYEVDELIAKNRYKEFTSKMF